MAPPTEGKRGNVLPAAIAEKLFLLLCLGYGFTFASPFSDPRIPENEHSLYRAYDDGKAVPVERTITGDDKYYHVRHTDTTELEVVSVIDRQTLGTIAVEKFRNGKPVIRVARDSAGIIVEEVQKNKKRRFRQGGIVYDRHTLWEVLRGFPFDKESRLEFPLLVPELGVLTAVVSLEKKEFIDTDFGRFECFKLKLAPKGVVGLLYNKRFYFWFRSTLPHPLIFYRDSDGRETKIERLTP